jgi:hypothetical protein
MAADTRTAKCAHSNSDLHAQEPGPGGIAENYGVSQPTISRAISAITPLLVQAFLDYVPTAHELDAGTCYIVDGTLLPCWSWRAHPELYSGKHKTTGMNVQIARTITRYLAWISDSISGSRHDNHCLGESGVLLRSTRATGSVIKDMSATT